MDKLFCPVCQELNQRSRVNESSSISTAMGVSAYYDEDGIYHFHDPNIVSTHYTCSDGHQFMVSRKKACACGYNAGKPEVRVLKTHYE